MYILFIIVFFPSAPQHSLISCLLLIKVFLEISLKEAEFLAKQDIYHDYIGTRVLEMIDSTSAEKLPSWTSTKGEWDILRYSWLFRVIFFVFLLGVLVKFINKLEPKQQE